MINNPVIFYSASFFIILFAIFALFAKNVIYSLLWATLVFFFGAVFFYILGSEYNAIIQAAIYGFAVPVIIGVSIMFCGSRGRGKYGGKCGGKSGGNNSGSKSQSERRFVLSYITLMCVAIFVLGFVYLIMMSLVIMPDTFNIMDAIQTTAFDNILAFAKGIFINYVWAFELVSLLLTIVIAGISMTARRRNGHNNL